MCGIAAYIGKDHCKRFVMEGLSRLEYRGYDSAGFACIDSSNGHLSFSKAKGKILSLEEKLQEDQFNGFVGLGHTRWATHGVADETNAHPHLDCHGEIAVVHNGIIESHNEIRKNLQAQGHNFSSSTDTETVAHLFEKLLNECSGNLRETVGELVKYLKGAFALVFLLKKHPDKLIVVRHRSPIALGIGQDETFVSSDPLVFSDKTKKVLFLPDDSFAIVGSKEFDLYSFTGESILPTIKEVNFEYKDNGKDGFDHYMLKEIYEQKHAITKTTFHYKQLAAQGKLWEHLGIAEDNLKNLKSINLVAAGTSWHAARISQFYFEQVCKVPARVFLASEFRYMPLFKEENSLYILISQSGETADTLEAMRLISSKGIPTLALTNVGSSTMVREAGGSMIMQAGPEVSVCSTKAFSAQLASLYWLAHQIGFHNSLISEEEMDNAQENLLLCGEILETTIEKYKQEIVETLAPRYSAYDRFIFLGRNISYPFALEAALKLKEISYIFAQCYPSGELKHGPIALIDERTPVILFSLLDDLIYAKLLSNASEIKARGGHLVVFAFEGQDELIELADYAFIVPKVDPLLAPLAQTGVMQFFVYQITNYLGLPVDKPRNLAKSVTVE